MRKNSIILISVILISVGMAFAVRNHFFKASDMRNEMSIDMLQKETLIVQNFFTQEDFSEEELVQLRKDESEAAKQSEFIFRVSPTGNLYLNRSVIMQEVVVESVIRGECSGKKIWISSQSSTIMENEEGIYTFLGLYYSLMQKGDEYLVFCKPSEINPYVEQEVYDIEDSLWFSYYNLSRDSSKIMQNAYYSSEIELYTDSEWILESFHDLKKAIFRELSIPM